MMASASPRSASAWAIRTSKQRFATLEDLRGFLLAAGQTAEDMFTRPPKSPLALQAMADERAAFCGFIQRITPDDLNEVAPLPYRRTLSKEEHKALWARLFERWG